MWAATPNDINKVASDCPYPAHPMNWIMAYCAFIAETDDEIAIQDSACFKKASSELKNLKNECATKKKYKAKKCELLIKEKVVAHKTVEECLKDESIRPFFAGG